MLPGRPEVVVAGRAGALHFEVIDTGNRGPGRRPVTGIASLSSPDVCRRLARRLNLTCLGVAAVTGRRRPRKNSVVVAGLAVRESVHAFQAKTRREMVERRLGL